MGPEQLLIDFLLKAQRCETEQIIFDRIRALSDSDFDNFVEELKTWGFLTFDDIHKIGEN